MVRVLVLVLVSMFMYPAINCPEHCPERLGARGVASDTVATTTDATTVATILFRRAPLVVSPQRPLSRLNALPCIIIIIAAAVATTASAATATATTAIATVRDRVAARHQPQCPARRVPERARQSRAASQ